LQGDGEGEGRLGKGFFHAVNKNQLNSTQLHAVNAVTTTTTQQQQDEEKKEEETRPAVVGVCGCVS
jgi:hypothetical protein